MGMDYAGNSEKDKEKAQQPKPKIEKVVSAEVIVPKKGIGKRIKDVFIEADFRSVVSYVVTDVLIPAARNMIVDGASRGVERLMYGVNSPRRYTPYGSGPAPRYSYNNNPLNREPSRDPRTAPPKQVGPRSAGRYGSMDFIVSDRSEAETVMERMNDIIDVYDVASVHDLNELLGLQTNPIDLKWGWVFLADTPIRQVREGYVIELPPPEPIS